MNRASPVRATASSAPPGSPPSRPAGAEPSLLPDPNVGGADPLAVLYLFEAQDQTLEVAQGTNQVASLQAERNQAFQKELQAIADEASAAQHHSFWDDLGAVMGEVAKVAGVVASVAAAVVTVGAATPLVVLAVVGAVVSTAAMADGEFHLLEKLGVDPETAGWIDLGAGVAGAVCSAGASLIAGAQAASSAANAVNQVASATAGAATVGEGAATIEAGDAQSDAERASADEVAGRVQSDRTLRFMQTVIDEIQSSDQESEQILSTIAATKGTLNETATNAAIAVQG